MPFVLIAVTYCITGVGIALPSKLDSMSRDALRCKTVEPKPHSISFVISTYPEDRIVELADRKRRHCSLLDERSRLNGEDIQRVTRHVADDLLAPEHPCLPIITRHSHHLFRPHAT